MPAVPPGSRWLPAPNSQVPTGLLPNGAASTWQVSLGAGSSCAMSTPLPQERIGQPSHTTLSHHTAPHAELTHTLSTPHHTAQVGRSRVRSPASRVQPRRPCWPACTALNGDTQTALDVTIGLVARPVSTAPSADRPSPLRSRVHRWSLPAHDDCPPTDNLSRFPQPQARPQCVTPARPTGSRRR